jgi:hypothetical protein
MVNLQKVNPKALVNVFGKLTLEVGIFFYKYYVKYHLAKPNVREIDILQYKLLFI